MQPPPEATGSAPVPNTEQADAWNGDEGRHWIQHRERYDQIMQRFTPHLFKAADVAAVEQVIDIGCGSGETTCLAARAAGHGLALGVDLSGPLLDEARCRAEHEGLTNARFEQGDVQVHPFPPAGYDLAISRFGVMFFEAPTVAGGDLGARPARFRRPPPLLDALRGQARGRRTMRAADVPAAPNRNVPAERDAMRETADSVAASLSTAC